jgi:hypothetical protein
MFEYGLDSSGSEYSLMTDVCKNHKILLIAYRAVNFFTG